MIKLTFLLGCSNDVKEHRRKAWLIAFDDAK